MTVEKDADENLRCGHSNELAFEIVEGLFLRKGAQDASTSRTDLRILQ